MDFQLYTIFSVAQKLYMDSVSVFQGLSIQNEEVDDVGAILLIWGVKPTDKLQSI
jgi:hypothetical protein